MLFSLLYWKDSFQSYGVWVFWECKYKYSKAFTTNSLRCK